MYIIGEYEPRSLKSKEFGCEVVRYSKVRVHTLIRGRQHAVLVMKSLGECSSPG